MILKPSYQQPGVQLPLESNKGNLRITRGNLEN